MHKSYGITYKYLISEIIIFQSQRNVVHNIISSSSKPLILETLIQKMTALICHYAKIPFLHNYFNMLHHNMQNKWIYPNECNININKKPNSMRNYNIIREQKIQAFRYLFFFQNKIYARSERKKTSFKNKTCLKTNQH